LELTYQLVRERFLWKEISPRVKPGEESNVELFLRFLDFLWFEGVMEELGLEEG
jgi:hypothetical protein